MTLQALRIARERDRANREAAAAKSVSEFLTGLFRVSDPSEARGNTITARQILDQGVKQVEAGLSRVGRGAWRGRGGVLGGGGSLKKKKKNENLKTTNFHYNLEKSTFYSALHKLHLL